MLRFFFSALVITGVLFSPPLVAGMSQPGRDGQAIPRTDNKTPENQEQREKNFDKYKSENTGEDQNDRTEESSLKKSRLKYRDPFECGC